MSDTGNLYADLSAYYDHFCADIDYAGQSACARRLFTLFSGSGGRDYLDLACGTGQHMIHMQPHGFTLSGLDNSIQMLQQARLRCPDAQVLHCDMAALAGVAAYDLITCFLYSIHYSHPVFRLRDTLNCVWQALKPGGVFVFNAVDAGGVVKQRNISSQVQAGDATLRFSSGWHYRGEGESMDLHLTISSETLQVKQQWTDRHTMTAISILQLQHMLVSIGFDVTVLEHDYDVLKAWSSSFNAIFVAVKPLPRLDS